MKLSKTYSPCVRNRGIRNTIFYLILSVAKEMSSSKQEENKPPGRQTKLEASLFISKLTSRDYKITVLQLQQFKEQQEKSRRDDRPVEESLSKSCKKVWEKASVIIAPFVEKNKSICPQVSAKIVMNICIQRKQIYIFIYCIYLTVDYRHKERYRDLQSEAHVHRSL